METLCLLCSSQQHTACLIRDKERGRERMDALYDEVELVLAERMMWEEDASGG